MMNGLEAMAGRAGSFVTLEEAARRTGLADSAAGMSAYCAASGAALGQVDGRLLVDVDQFRGDRADLVLGEVTVLEVGVLL